MKKVKEESKVEEVAAVPSENELTLTEYDHKKIDNDMNYRGPLSYRYLRIIAWISMTLMFISITLGVGMKIRGVMGASADNLEGLSRASNILSYFSALPLPLFLIANFAIILQHKGNYKKLISMYGKLLLGVYVGFMFIYYHYIVISLMCLGGMSFVEARNLSVDIFTILGEQSGLVVNVFVDLICCVFIMLFIDYTPKKRFKGKKIILFRCLVIIPILYEVISAILMGLLGMNNLFIDFTFSLPPEILPLIGKKPIGMILAFVAICIYIKIKEKIYLKRGGTEEGYKLYLETNRNSFKFSLVLSIIFLIVALLDFFTLLISTAIINGDNTNQSYTTIIINVLSNFTLGKSVVLIVCIPFIMLFSYTKRHNDPKTDILVAMGGIGLLVFAVIETIFFCLVL